MIKRVISNGFYHLINVDPSHSPTDSVGNRIVLEIERCVLDPGGLFHQIVPWTEFELGGETFAIQAHNAERVLRMIKENREDRPDYTMFKMWNYNVYLSSELCDSLISKLEEMANSVEAAHAELDVHQNVANLESDTRGMLVSQGRSPKELYERLKELGF